MNETRTIRVNRNITLKPVEMSDSTDIFNTIDSQRTYLGKWLAFVEATRKIEDTQAFVKSIIESPVNEREHVFVIQFEGRFVGLIGFKSIDMQNRRTEMGYWLSEPFQGRGVVTESLKALIKFAFNDMGMNRIQIRCATENLSSRRIPLRTGFKFEGIERDGEILTGGKFNDLAVYSLLANEWDEQPVASLYPAG